MEWMCELLDQRARKLAAQPDQVHCMDAFELLRLLSDNSVDMILVDMPYGVTQAKWDTVIDLDAWWAEAHRVAKPRAAIVCTGSQPFTTTLIASNIKRFRYEWIWEKDKPTGFLDANKKPLKYHENILIFSEQEANYEPIKTDGHQPANQPARKRRPTDIYHKFDIYDGGGNTDRFPRSIQKFNVVNSAHGVVHPTQKPVALFEYLIRTYTQPGDLVLDPFVGSGTTALAARACGRHYICGDSDAGYVDIARDRLRLPFEPRHVNQETRFDDLPLFQAAQESADRAAVAAQDGNTLNTANSTK